MPADTVEVAAPTAGTGDDTGFRLTLDNFEGPFDLLLQLIAKHQLDIGDIALHRVTDDFIAHLAGRGDDWDLEETTSFLVVASTLLDLKIVRLLPSAELEDEADLALLEARDLLFARLMQYRAFKLAAAQIAARMQEESARVPRSVGLDEHLAGLLPEVLLTIGATELAMLAARALAPREPAVLGLDHIHVSRVSVAEQAGILMERLRAHRSATFRGLTSDSPDTLTTVARFLALLELYREGVVAFEQASPLGELNVRWTGTDDTAVEIVDEYDEHEESADPPSISDTTTGDPGTEAAR